MRHPGRSDGQDRATIRDVAVAAGVSTATVSRTLSRSELVTAGLAQRVRAAATALHYIPNAAARALSSLHSGQVGVLVEGLSRHGATVAAVIGRLAESGLATLVFELAGRTDDATVAILRDHDLEGAVTVGGPVREAIRAVLTERAMPWVEAGGAGVAIDMLPAAAALADYVTALGHETVGYVSGAVGDTGWLALVASRFGVPAAATGLADLAVASGGPTALLCGDDLVALEVLQRCHGRGIRVPDDLTVIGFGDRPFAAAAAPALTTIRLPVAALGEAAVDRLLAFRAGRAAAPVSLAAKLVIRRSSGLVSRGTG